MKKLKKGLLYPINILQFLYCIYALLVFAILTIVSVITMLFLIPFSKSKLSKRVYKICRYWAKAFLILIGVRHIEIFEDQHDFKKPHIFVANHNSYMDIPPIVQLKHQPIKPLGKFESSKIPIFGWIYRAAVIMVDRSSPDKRAKSLRNLKAALHRKVSIFIFPEGTFSMTEERPLKNFYNGAFKLAIEMQVPIQPILLVDAVDRMHYSSVFTLTPGKNRVVYLPTVKVDEYTMDDIEILKDKVYQMMDEGLRRYRNYPRSN
jgi:1-acyl-sn-glycerol-3-phosphate acyltransferase